MAQKEKIVFDYFISHQSTTTHAFIVNFSTILAFFVYAGKPRAVLECKITHSRDIVSKVSNLHQRYSCGTTKMFTIIVSIKFLYKEEEEEEEEGRKYFFLDKQTIFAIIPQTYVYHCYSISTFEKRQI